MTTGTIDNRLSLLELVNENTDLILSRRPDPCDVPERRTQARFEPAKALTLRLDVLGGVWSAKVKDISAASACLQLDPEIATQIENGQPASIWLESRAGIPLRLEGSLRTLRNPDRTAPDDPLPVTFTCEPHMPLTAPPAAR
ncbi:MAG: hypothetical protein V2A79_18760 [Planctomycetota bacterium]